MGRETAEVIVGTSAGSLTGAILRAGLPPTDLAARALGRPLSRDGQRVMVGVGPPPTAFPLRAARGERRGPAEPGALARPRCGRGRSAQARSPPH